MRTIVHLSDLHFGAIDRRLISPLIATIAVVNPDLVAVSGDLTQRARVSQFREARAFLDALNRPLLVVPGNHDIPLYDLARRFVSPLARYRRYITADLAPEFSDREIVVVGLNSTRSLSWRHGPGRLNRRQVVQAAARLQSANPGAIKIVVTHHPFDLPAGKHARHLIGRAHMAMGWLAAAGADLFLAGHLHVAHIGQTAERYQIAGHSALVIQAGTLSRRERGEASSFNVIRIDGGTVGIDRYSWIERAGQFASESAGSFGHTTNGWRPQAAI